MDNMDESKILCTSSIHAVSCGIPAKSQGCGNAAFRVSGTEGRAFEPRQAYHNISNNLQPKQKVEKPSKTASHQHPSTTRLRLPPADIPLVPANNSVHAVNIELIESS